jgi:ATP-dependent Clp protease ATP-binding subunit ClpA
MEADRLTTKAQEAVSTAVRRAAAAGHPEVAAVHLLLALLDQESGIAVPLLTAAGSDPTALRAQADQTLRGLPTASGAQVAAPSLSRGVLTAFEAALTYSSPSIYSLRCDRRQNATHWSKPSRRCAAAADPSPPRTLKRPTRP